MKSYQQFCDVLSQRFNELSKQLKTIAEFVLDNPNDTALYTTSELAKRIGVQPSSLIRFAQALDFDGFSDLQAVFRSRLIARLPAQTSDYPERIRKLKGASDKRRYQGVDATLEIVAKFIEGNKAALDQLGNELDPAQFSKAIKILHTSRSVYILGQRRSFPAASYLYYGMSQLKIQAYLLDSVGGLLQEQTSRIGKEDALIAITFPRYTDFVLDATTTARETGAKIIAVTDNAISPIVPLCDIRFFTDSVSIGGFRTVAATFCLVQALIVGLG